MGRESFLVSFPFSPTQYPRIKAEGSGRRETERDETGGAWNLKPPAQQGTVSPPVSSGRVDCGKPSAATWRQCDVEASRGAVWGARASRGALPRGPWERVPSSRPHLCLDPDADCNGS